MMNQRMTMTDRKPYRPNSGIEGMWFISQWCVNCKRDRVANGSVEAGDENDEDMCPIIAATFAHDIDDPEYPVEWIRDADGRPCCTEFEDVGDPGGVSVAVADDRTEDLFGGGR